MNTLIASPSLSADPFAALAAMITALLNGPLATTLAVIAVAFFGLQLLGGTIDMRRAGRLVIGCFLVFGASTLAAGLMSAARGWAGEAPRNATISTTIVPSAPPMRVLDY